MAGSGTGLVLFAEGLFGRNHDGPPLVSRRDNFGKDAGFGLILCGIGEVTEDQKIEVVALGDGWLETCTIEASTILPYGRYRSAPLC